MLVSNSESVHKVVVVLYHFLNIDTGPEARIQTQQITKVSRVHPLGITNFKGPDFKALYLLICIDITVCNKQPSLWRDFEFFFLNFFVN